jgi:hypothetical protein
MPASWNASSGSLRFLDVTVSIPTYFVVNDHKSDNLQLHTLRVTSQYFDALSITLAYEVVSKIFRTGASIYTPVAVARSTNPNRSNCEFYCDVLRRLRENVRRRCPELWREQTWLLHHDNAPSHTSVLTQEFLVKYKMAVIPHPPCFSI